MHQIQYSLESHTVLLESDRDVVTALVEYTRASLVAQRVKRLPVMQETWVRSLGQEDLLEKEMATHSSTLAWKIPWTREAW